MNVISKYASLVKFSHTLFALPFALIAYVYALHSTGTPFEWLLLVKIVLCMVFARNAAMGFNRWADRDIDARNPRTSMREIPAGRISARAAIIFVAANALFFVLCALWINRTAFWLSPAALFVILSYSYAKRVTAWSHIVLGLALAIAPSGAYIAVTGTIAFFPMVLSALVLTWVGGFDILYALQDVDFDRRSALKSLPARYSPTAAKVISIVLHALTLYIVITSGLIFGFHRPYWTGSAIFAILLIIQHIVYTPARANRIGASFGLVNGASSIAFATFAIADMLVY